MNNLENEMPGCAVVVSFGFASLVFISFVTELFKYFDRIPGQARNTELGQKLFIIFTELQSSHGLFRIGIVLQKSG